MESARAQPVSAARDARRRERRVWQQQEQPVLQQRALRVFREVQPRQVFRERQVSQRGS